MTGTRRHVELARLEQRPTLRGVTIAATADGVWHDAPCRWQRSLRTSKRFRRDVCRDRRRQRDLE